MKLCGEWCYDMERERNLACDITSEDGTHGELAHRDGDRRWLDAFIWTGPPDDREGLQAALAEQGIAHD